VIVKGLEVFEASKMKCPKCGDNKLQYKVQRKRLTGVHEKPKPRTDFTVKKCKRCGFEGEVKP